MKLKLRAYTLFEVIISMVIMSIISLIVFVLFSSFLKQLNLFNETNSRLASYTFLKNNLKREFYISKSVKSIPNGIKIEMNDTLDVSYYFNNDYIVKKTNYTFDTIPVTITEIDKKIKNDNYITQLNLNFLIFGESLKLVLNKKHMNKIEINK